MLSDLSEAARGLDITIRGLYESGEADDELFVVIDINCQTERQGALTTSSMRSFTGVLSQ